MSTSAFDAAAAWQDAALAAALIAVAPAYLGGVHLKALPGPVRETWLETLRAMLPSDAPLRRVPSHVDAAGLLGGLDLPATLQVLAKDAKIQVVADLCLFTEDDETVDLSCEGDDTVMSPLLMKSLNKFF